MNFISTTRIDCTLVCMNINANIKIVFILLVHSYGSIGYQERRRYLNLDTRSIILSTDFCFGLIFFFFPEISVDIQPYVLRWDVRYIVHHICTVRVIRVFCPCPSQSLWRWSPHYDVTDLQSKQPSLSQCYALQSFRSLIVDSSH